ncbi:putative holin-like toxin [Effusibacillus consociatus]|uniref:Holin-like toxin n=1 Tax=Effusibacillus consociatus TaxID=1117041 RepID=A0ABV9Q3H4_9BACL
MMGGGQPMEIKDALLLMISFGSFIVGLVSVMVALTKKK